MTRRILTALTAISFALLAFASPHSAQERQVGGRTPGGVRSTDNRQIVDMAEAENFRNKLITAYEESEALIRYLAGYDFIRQSDAMKDYESVCQELTKERVRTERLSAGEVMSQAGTRTDMSSLNRVIAVSRIVRNDAKVQAVFQKVERFSQAGLTPRSSSSAQAYKFRDVVAAPAYIPPTCDYNDPSNYPSGADIAIANGVALALRTIADAIPETFTFCFIGCIDIPNPIHIAVVIAAGVADQVTNALNAVKADGGYCELLRIFIEEQMETDGQIFGIQMQDFYITFTLRSIRAGVAKAQADGVPINCAMTRLTEANTYFNGSDSFIGTGPQRVEALRKLRAAYQNIGASTCVQ